MSDFLATDEQDKRDAAAWKCSEDKSQIAAWAAPKADRRRMINTLLQINANLVFCFRARGAAGSEDCDECPLNNWLGHTNAEIDSLEELDE